GSDRGSVCGARAISSVLPRQGGHRRGPWRRFSSDGQDYLTVLSPLSFLFDLSTGNHVLEKIEEIHRLVHEVPGDPISRVESEHEFQVVDLPHAHQIRNGALRPRLAHTQRRSPVRIRSSPLFLPVADAGPDRETNAINVRPSR